MLSKCNSSVQTYFFSATKAASKIVFQCQGACEL